MEFFSFICKQINSILHLFSRLIQSRVAEYYSFGYEWFQISFSKFLSQLCIFADRILNEAILLCVNKCKQKTVYKRRNIKFLLYEFTAKKYVCSGAARNWHNHVSTIWITPLSPIHFVQHSSTTLCYSILNPKNSTTLLIYIMKNKTEYIVC